MLPPNLASNQAFLSPARSALSVSSENIWIAGKQCDLVSLRVAKVAFGTQPRLIRTVSEVGREEEEEEEEEEMSMGVST